MLDQNGNANDHDNPASSAGQALAGQSQRAPRTQAHDEGAREPRSRDRSQRERRRTTTPSSPPPSCSAPTTAGAGTSPSGTPRPDCASASSKGSRPSSDYFDLTELAEVTVFGSVPRRGARPVLGAEDPGRDQETVGMDGGLVNSAHERNQRRNKERSNHA